MGVRDCIHLSADLGEPQPAHHRQTNCELRFAMCVCFKAAFLQELLTVYENSGEKWRAMSTKKVLQAVKKHPREITTLEVRAKDTSELI